jgi:hypothetical protein
MNKQPEKLRELTKEELKEVRGGDSNGQNGYEGQPGNQGNGTNGYEGQPSWDEPAPVAGSSTSGFGNGRRIAVAPRISSPDADFRIPAPADRRSLEPASSRHFVFTLPIAGADCVDCELSELSQNEEQGAGHGFTGHR